jgi:hypothetical protein
LPATRSAWRREPVGKDQLATRQPLDGGGQLGGLGHAGEVDVVHVVEERLGVHAMHLHQAGQSGAELAVVGLLQVPRVVVGHAEIAGDEFAHAPVDLREQVALGGIERVVEVEDPHLRALEGAACD